MLPPLSSHVSWQMRALTVMMRRIARPHLRRTRTPEAAATDFERGARRLFRRPPFVRHLIRPLIRPVVQSPNRPMGPLALHWISAGPTAPRRVILYFHGGAYLSGSPQTHLGMIARISRLSGIEVCAPAYRLLQEAPFPAAFEDACAAWDHLAALGYRPADIVMGGDSAGAGLMLALLADLSARGQTPCAAFALSPWVDLTLSGASLTDPAEPILPTERMAEVVDLYLRGADPDDPRASPLFARFASPPPVLIQVGSTEALRDDSTRMADHLRAAGGQVTVEVWPDAPHVWQMLDGWVPEARAALRHVATFVQTSFDKAMR